MLEELSQSDLESLVLLTELTLSFFMTTRLGTEYSLKVVAEAFLGVISILSQDGADEQSSVLVSLIFEVISLSSWRFSLPL